MNIPVLDHYVILLIIDRDRLDVAQAEGAVLYRSRAFALRYEVLHVSLISSRDGLTVENDTSLVVVLRHVDQANSVGADVLQDQVCLCY